MESETLHRVSGCTANPNRKCRMCERLLAAEFDHTQAPMERLLFAAPGCELVVAAAFAGAGDLSAAIAARMRELREVAGCCPACIGAALRQKGFPWDAADFDFDAECKKFWDKVNSAEARRCHHG